MAPIVWLTAIVAAFLVPTVFPSNFWLYLLDVTLINGVLALGLNVILKTGQISMAHAGFMAIGAFTSAQLTVKLEVPFLAAFLLGGVAAAGAALCLGRIILRLKGVYFLLFTFALNEFLFLLSKNVPALTGGNTGVVGIRPPALPFVGVLRSKAAFYYFALTVLVLAIALVAALYRSPFGRAMNAVRESELLAAAAGYNPMRIKVVAFAVGCWLAGLGGGLFAHFLGYVAPFNFTFWESVNFLLMNIVGGTPFLAGAIVGALVITPLPELLRAYVVWQQVLYGLTLMAFMRFLPDGIVSLLDAPVRAGLAWLGSAGRPARVRPADGAGGTA
jgi:branched-chain amino acid transport system permease protein